MNNPTEYFILYPCTGRTHTYTFSIDACTPVRTMTKRSSPPCTSPMSRMAKSESLKEPFDQMIDYGRFFHVGIRPEGSTNRFQMLKRNSYGQGYRKD